MCLCTAEASGLKQNDDKEYKYKVSTVDFTVCFRSGVVEEVMCFHGEQSRYKNDKYKSNTWVIQSKVKSTVLPKMMIPFF